MHSLNDTNDSTWSPCNVMHEVFHRVRRALSSCMPGSTHSVHFVVENVDWSIRWDGIYITRGVSHRGIASTVCVPSRLPRNRLVHFGCLHLGVSGTDRALERGNRVLMTLFHGDFNLSEGVDRSLRRFLELVPRLERVVVSNRIMESRLLSWGVPREKLVRIPLGVDTAAFTPASAAEKSRLRKHLGIPERAVCIGSFQKDGEGWGEGLKPKRIKGPDRFVEVVAALSQKFPIHCLLTGPSRGYVKNALAERGIPLTHRHLEDYTGIVDYYRCLDLYLVTSREEGGPKAVLEAPACGIPIVSTPVGMAPEVLQNAGILAAEVPELIDASTRILSDPALAGRLSAAGPALAKTYDWDAIAAQYHSLYQELLK